MCISGLQSFFRFSEDVFTLQVNMGPGAHRHDSRNGTDEVSLEIGFNVCHEGRHVQADKDDQHLYCDDIITCNCTGDT